MATKTQAELDAEAKIAAARTAAATKSSTPVAPLSVPIFTANPIPGNVTPEEMQDAIVRLDILQRQTENRTAAVAGMTVAEADAAHREAQNVMSAIRTRNVAEIDAAAAAKRKSDQDLTAAILAYKVPDLADEKKAIARQDAVTIPIGDQPATPDETVAISDIPADNVDYVRRTAAVVFKEADTRYAAIPSDKAVLRQDMIMGEIVPGVPIPRPGRVFETDSNMILSARGTFYLVKLAGFYGPGLYGIDELNRETYRDNFFTGMESLGQPLTGGSKSPILITGIEFNQVDITSQVPCLENIKVFYTFGQNFGQVVISGEVLLGPLGDISYDGINRLIKFFWKNRVSEKKSAIAVSVAEKSYYVYLTGMKIGTINPEFHVMPFVLFGTLLDINHEKPGQINTAGLVITGGTLDEPSLFKALKTETAASDSLIGNIDDEKGNLSKSKSASRQADNAIKSKDPDTGTATLPARHPNGEAIRASDMTIFETPGIGSDIRNLKQQRAYLRDKQLQYTQKLWSSGTLTQEIDEINIAIEHGNVLWERAQAQQTGGTIIFSGEEEEAQRLYDKWVTKAHANADKLKDVTEEQRPNGDVIFSYTGFSQPTGPVYTPPQLPARFKF